MKQLKYAALVAMAVLATAPLWAGPQARIFGIVTDTAGNPVPTATITYTTDELTTFEKAIPVKGDGTFKALILDATRVYIFHVSAPGYIGQDQEFKVPVGTTDNRFEFVPIAESSPATGDQTKTYGQLRQFYRPDRLEVF